MWFGIAIANCFLVFAIDIMIRNAPWQKIADEKEKQSELKESLLTKEKSVILNKWKNR